MTDKLSQLKILTDLFASNIAQYKSGQYDESNVRVDFIDKFCNRERLPFSPFRNFHFL
jgi:hypothetical protein